MTIGAIGLMGGTIPVNNLVTEKSSRVERPVTESIGKVNIDDRLKHTFGAADSRNIDRIDFSLEEIKSRQTEDKNRQQALEEKRVLENSQRELEVVREANKNEREARLSGDQGVVGDIRSNLEQFLQGIVQNMQSAGSDNNEEKPDFRAISLIKASYIPPPEPPDFTEKALEARENPLAKTELGQRLAAGVSGLHDGAGNIKETSIVQNTFTAGNEAAQGGASEASGINAAANINTSPPPTDNISNYVSERFSQVSRQLASANAKKSLAMFENYSSEALSRIEERIRESATARSSDEIAKDYEATRITPEQTQGIMVYQQFQDYSESINLSLARIAV